MTSNCIQRVLLHLYRNLDTTAISHFLCILTYRKRKRSSVCKINATLSWGNHEIAMIRRGDGKRNRIGRSGGAGEKKSVKRQIRRVIKGATWWFRMELRRQLSNKIISYRPARQRVESMLICGGTLAPNTHQFFLHSVLTPFTIWFDV